MPLNPFDFSPLDGVKIIESPDMPRIQLGTHTTVTKYGDVVEWITPEERAKTNAWLREFFGTINVVPPGQVFLMELLGYAVMNPADIVKIRSVL